MTLDVEAIRSAIIARLPPRARWSINGTPLDYDFGAARRELRELPADAVESGGDKYLDLLFFGDYDYAEGGGAHPWLGVRKTDGAVCGLDPESDSPLFFVNSSVEGFIRTFTLLDQYLGKDRQLPPDIDTRAREIDPEGYPASDWRLLIASLKGAV